MKTIGLLTIGQSPRDDVLPGLLEILGEGYEIIEAGALDDLTLEDINKVEFKHDDYILVSRMRDGAREEDLLQGDTKFLYAQSM
jgi:protein AroM